MFQKRGEEHHIKLIGIICVILIILAAGVFIYDIIATNEPDNSTQNTINQPQNLSNNLPTELPKNQNIETIKIPVQVASDCLETEVYDETQKRCVFACENCTNQTYTKEILKSFLNEKPIQLYTDKVVTFIAYEITENQSVTPILNYRGITGVANQRFVENKSYENEILGFVSQLLPLHTIPKLRKLSIVSDSRFGSLTGLEYRSFDDTWELYVDVSDAFRSKFQKKRLTHELIKHFGEMFLFDHSQISKLESVSRPLSKAEQKILGKTCPNTYFSPYGCMKQGSYLDAYYKKFWSEIHAEWIDMENPKLLYSKYDNSFHKVDSTADPLSDMTNAWVYFIIADKPTGYTILDKKVLFFYEYPELLRIRDWIRANIE